MAKSVNMGEGHFDKVTTQAAKVLSEQDNTFTVKLFTRNGHQELAKFNGTLMKCLEQGAKWLVSEGDYIHNVWNVLQGTPAVKQFARKNLRAVVISPADPEKIFVAFRLVESAGRCGIEQQSPLVQGLDKALRDAEQAVRSPMPVVPAPGAFAMPNYKYEVRTWTLNDQSVWKMTGRVHHGKVADALKDAIHKANLGGVNTYVDVFFGDLNDKHSVPKSVCYFRNIYGKMHYCLTVSPKETHTIQALKDQFYPGEAVAMQKETMLAEHIEPPKTEPEHYHTQSSLFGQTQADIEAMMEAQEYPYDIDEDGEPIVVEEKLDSANVSSSIAANQQVKKPKLSAADLVKAVKALRDTGMTYQLIADTLEIQKGTVMSCLAKAEKSTKKAAQAPRTAPQPQSTVVQVRKKRRLDFDDEE